MDNRILDKWIEVARNKIGAKRKQSSYGRTGSTLSLPKKQIVQTILSELFPTKDEHPASFFAAVPPAYKDTDDVFIPSAQLDPSQVQVRRRPRNTLTPEMERKMKMLEKQLRARKSKSKRSGR